MKLKLKRPVICLACICVLASVFLGSCTKQTDTSSTDTSSTTTSSTDTSSTTTSGGTSSPTEPGELIPEVQRKDWPKGTPDITPISSEPVTLSFMITMDDAFGQPWDQMWFWAFLKEYHNITPDVEQVLNSAIAERKQLMLASNALPDIMLNLSFTSNEYAQYGMGEGMLLDLVPYINEKDTPNIVALFNFYEGAKSTVTLSNGAIYTTPSVGVPYNMGYYNSCIIWYYKAWFDELEIDKPKTLDDFTEALRKIKANAGIGSIPADVIPLGGAYNAQTPWAHIVNAFGYFTNDPSSPFLAPGLVKGEPSLLCYDRDIFPKVVKYANMLYSEGLISKDFFTMDNATVNGQLVNGLYATISTLPVTTPIVELKEQTGAKVDWKDYWVLPPVGTTDNPARLVSDVSSNWLYATGAFAASAATEEPIVVSRFLDFFYTGFGSNLAVTGVAPDPDNKYAMGWYEYVDPYGRHEDDDEETLFVKGRAYSENTQGLNPYILNQMAIGYQFSPGYWTQGVFDRIPSVIPYQEPIAWVGCMDPEQLNSNVYWRWCQCAYFYYMPYTTAKSYPSIYYLSPDDAKKQANLHTPIDNYFGQEFAKFVTGQTEINDENLNKYFSDVQGLGADELLSIYKAAYEPYR